MREVTIQESKVLIGRQERLNFEDTEEVSQERMKISKSEHERKEE